MSQNLDLWFNEAHNQWIVDTLANLGYELFVNPESGNYNVRPIPDPLLNSDVSQDIQSIEDPYLQQDAYPVNGEIPEQPSLLIEDAYSSIIQSVESEADIPEGAVAVYEDGELSGYTFPALIEAVNSRYGADAAQAAAGALGYEFEDLYAPTVADQPADIQEATQVGVDPQTGAPIYDYNVQVQIPTFEVGTQGGGGEEAGAEAPQEEVITDVAAEDTTGGSNSVYDAMDDSTVARQIHEAIILNPEIAGDLISEWEVYTGQTWDDSYINEDPYAGYETPVSEPVQPTPEQEQAPQQPTEEGVTVGTILDAANTIGTILGGSPDGSQTVTADGTATGTATEGTGTADGGAEGGAGGGVGTGTGTGTGSGEGDGSGETTAETAARSGFGDGFTPFYTSIGYQPVQMLAPVLPQQKDYMRELDGLFNRTISNRKQGMLV